MRKSKACTLLVTYLLIIISKSLPAQLNTIKTVNTSLFTNYSSWQFTYDNSGIYFLSRLKTTPPSYQTHVIKADSNFNCIYSKQLLIPALKNNNQILIGISMAGKNRLVTLVRDTLASNNQFVCNLTFINSSNGTVIWSKNIDSVFVLGVKYNNSKITIFGQCTNYDTYISLDTLGNVISSKKFNLVYTGTSGTFNYAIRAMDIGLDSSIYFLAPGGAGSPGTKIVKFDKYNNLQWCYEFKSSSNSHYSESICATQDGGATYFDYDMGILFKISKNGSCLWNKNFASLLLHNVYEKTNGDLFAFSYDLGFYYLLDKNGNFLNTKSNQSCASNPPTYIQIPFDSYQINFWNSDPNPPFCFPGATNRNYNAILSKTDYSMSTCNYTTFTCNFPGVTVSKGDSSISIYSFIPTINNTGASTPLVSNFIFTILEDACGLSFVNELSANNLIRLFPNPSKNSISIESENTLIDEIEIVNVIGKTIKKWHLPGSISANVDISGFQEGVYFIKLYNQNKFIGIKKILKE
jgi:hypothetical protein